MNVRQWRIALCGKSSYDNQPGLALTVRLRCPVCPAECEASYARVITPKTVREGNSDWFGFTVNSRLANPRYCDGCGAGSIIPPNQQQALIAASNAALSLTWLRQAVADFAFDTKTIPETEDSWPREVYVAKAGMTAMDWVSFARP